MGEVDRIVEARQAVQGRHRDVGHVGQSRMLSKTLLRYVRVTLSLPSVAVLTMAPSFVDIGSRECYVGMLYACYGPSSQCTLSWRSRGGHKPQRLHDCHS